MQEPFSVFDMDRAAIKADLYDIEFAHYSVNRIVSLGFWLEVDTLKKLDQIKTTH